MLINLRNAMMSGKRLPYDAEVEWVMGNTKAYIDVGVKGASDISIYLKVIAATTGNAIPLGVGRDGSYPRIICFMHWLCSDFYSSNRSGGRAYRSEPRISIGDTAEFWGNRSYREIKVNGVSVAYNNSSVTQDFTTTGNINIFRSPNQTSVDGGNGDVKFVAAQIYKSDICIRDFRPVRAGDAGAIYDRANPDGGPLGNGLYLSATSTPLTSGPDKNA